MKDLIIRVGQFAARKGVNPDETTVSELIEMMAEEEDE